MRKLVTSLCMVALSCTMLTSCGKEQLPQDPQTDVYELSFGYNTDEQVERLVAQRSKDGVNWQDAGIVFPDSGTDYTLPIRASTGEQVRMMAITRASTYYSEIILIK